MFTKPTIAFQREHNKESTLKAAILRIKLNTELQEQETQLISPN